MKGYESINLFSQDRFSLSTHALLSAIQIEKLSFGTGAVPLATMYVCMYICMYVCMYGGNFNLSAASKLLSSNWL